MNPNCRVFRDKLSVYVEGEMKPDERDTLTAHLSTCSACAQELGSLRQMLQEMKQIPSGRVPAHFRQKFWAKVDGPARPQPALQRVWEPWYLKIPVGALATAAVVLLAVRVTHVTAPVLRSKVSYEKVDSDQRMVADSSSAPQLRAADNLDGARSRQSYMQGSLAQDRKVQAQKLVAPAPEAAAGRPADEMREEQNLRKAPARSGRHLNVRLYAEDPMAANDRLLHLLAEIPTKFVEPPSPIHYDLLIQPERVEIFLKRLKPIGVSMDSQEEGTASPQSDSPVQVTVDILSSR